MRTKERKKKSTQGRRRTRVRLRVASKRGLLRLVVFRSSNHIYGQIIDDKKQITVISASDIDIEKQKKEDAVKGELRGKCLAAYRVGLMIASKAREKKIESIVFDRGGYQYHGRVKALADGAREGGLKF
jgi:large subunit ribosomal protein L18